MIAVVDGTAIAFNQIKLNKPNIPLIGAMIKLTNIITLEDINLIIKCNFQRKLGTKAVEANQLAAKEGYDQVKLVQK